MSPLQGVYVLLAGSFAGMINTVVGSGTLVTFPVLLSIGLPPVTANVTNTVGIFPGSLIGAYGYRAELRGQGRRVLVLTTAVLPGAVLGAVLLRVLPASAFKAIVPILIGLALILVVFGPRLNARLAANGIHRRSAVGPLLWIAIFATSVYGGYFGAAQGVLMMALFGLLLEDSLQRQNGLKNVQAGLVNLIAAVVFVITAHIDWAAAGLLAAGAGVGAVLGARVGRRLSPAALRAVIVVVGVLALVKLLA